MGWPKAWGQPAASRRMTTTHFLGWDAEGIYSSHRCHTWAGSGYLSQWPRPVLYLRSAPSNPACHWHPSRKMLLLINWFGINMTSSQGGGPKQFHLRYLYFPLRWTDNSFILSLIWCPQPPPEPPAQVAKSERTRPSSDRLLSPESRQLSPPHLRLTKFALSNIIYT